MQYHEGHASAGLSSFQVMGFKHCRTYGKKKLLFCTELIAHWPFSMCAHEKDDLILLPSQKVSSSLLKFLITRKSRNCPSYSQQFQYSSIQLLEIFSCQSFDLRKHWSFALLYRVLKALLYQVLKACKFQQDFAHLSAAYVYRYILQEQTKMKARLQKLQRRTGEPFLHRGESLRASRGKLSMYHALQTFPTCVWLSSLFHCWA